MARRTIYMTPEVEAIVVAAAREGESFSGTVTRLIETASRAEWPRTRPTWIGAGEGPGDLGERAEEYLRRPVSSK